MILWHRSHKYPYKQLGYILSPSEAEVLEQLNQEFKITTCGTPGSIRCKSGNAQAPLLRAPSKSHLLDRSSQPVTHPRAWAASWTHIRALHWLDCFLPAGLHSKGTALGLSAWLFGACSRQTIPCTPIKGIEWDRWRWVRSPGARPNPRAGPGAGRDPRLGPVGYGLIHTTTQSPSLTAGFPTSPGSSSSGSLRFHNLIPFPLQASPSIPGPTLTWRWGKGRGKAGPWCQLPQLLLWPHWSWVPVYLLKIWVVCKLQLQYMACSNWPLPSLPTLC